MSPRDAPRVTTLPQHILRHRPNPHHRKIWVGGLVALPCYIGIVVIGNELSGVFVVHGDLMRLSVNGHCAEFDVGGPLEKISSFSGIAGVEKVTLTCTPPT